MQGRLTVVGIGPGAPEHRTAAATRAIVAADVVVGYTPYVDLCADLLDGKDVVRGRMGEEEARAEAALARARAGARVALVSSGDPGVHGMAARTLALAAALPAGERPPVRVLPGVTAALAAAARLGAPLGDDWASLSLSDLHVGWETVERRLAGVAAAGIALALYNPASRTRPFDRALAVLAAHRAPATPVVCAAEVSRPCEALLTTTLGELDPAAVTMRSIVLVAGDTGALAGPWLVASRGRRAAEATA